MPRSRSRTSPSDAQRLPVHPRRTKVAPEQRRRVATACNACNVRRVKCSGERPCSQCQEGSRDCVYPVPVDKVTIAKSEYEELRAKCASLESRLQERGPDNPRRQQPFDFNTSPSGASPSQSPATANGTAGDAEEPPSTPEDGRLLRDTDGTVRYLGETSGATFLDNLKQFMGTIFPLAFDDGSVPEHGGGYTFLASLGQYQTFDSRPLPPRDVDPFWLPQPPEMSTKLYLLRLFIQDGGASGGIYFWGNLHSIPDASRLISTTTEDRLVADRGMAFYHAAFAYASLFSPTTASSREEGEKFFARARKLLGNPLEVSTYSSTDVAAMALMGLYMVEMNRRDAAYMYITTAMHTSLMQGIHRGRSTNERDRRIFWTVYILDRWISCLMGRPPTIMDDAIKLELPSDVPGLPSCVGLKAHIELAKISGEIVCDTYRIAGSTLADAKPATTGTTHVYKAVELLSRWLDRLPDELSMPNDTFSKDRPLCALHMSYNQLLILSIRPIFFTAVKKAVATRFLPQSRHQGGQAVLGQHQRHSDGSSPPSYRGIARPPFHTPSAGIEDHHPHIDLLRKCSKAARHNLRLGRWLALPDVSPAQKLLLPQMHCVFNAAIMLLLHQIAFVDLEQDDVSGIKFALAAFEHEATAGDTYAADCLRVMQDLASLVKQLRALIFIDVPHIPSPQFGATGPVVTSTGFSPTPSPLPPAAALANFPHRIPGVAAPGQQPSLASPGIDGTQPAAAPAYLHPHGYIPGGDGIDFSDFPSTAVSTTIVGGDTPAIGYAHMEQAPSTGIGEVVLYNELLGWWHQDSGFVPPFNM